MQINIAPVILDLERELIQYIGELYSAINMKDLVTFTSFILISIQAYILYMLREVSEISARGVDEE